LRQDISTRRHRWVPRGCDILVKPSSDDA